jgi:hypothetical protein
MYKNSLKSVSYLLGEYNSHMYKTPVKPEPNNQVCENSVFCPKNLFPETPPLKLFKMIDKSVTSCLLFTWLCNPCIQCVKALKQVLARPYRYAYVKAYVGTRKPASISHILSVYQNTHQLYCRCNQSVVRTIAVMAAGMLQLKLQDINITKK